MTDLNQDRPNQSEPDQIDTGTDSMQPTDETSVPHSGISGLEKPVVEFDNTSLEEAVARDLVQTPDSPKALIEAPKPRKKLARWAIAATAGLGIAGGAFVLGSRSTNNEATSDTIPASLAPSNETPVTSLQAPVEIDSTDEFQPQTTAYEETVTTDAPTGVYQTAPNGEVEATNTTYGNVDIANSANEAEGTITTTRANGETITLPTLQSTNEINDFGESAVALMTAYLTTGDQAILDQFSADIESQDLLKDMRKNVFIDPNEPISTLSTAPNFQMVTYDEASDPVEWKFDSFTGAVDLVGGTLYTRFSDDPKWQGLNSSEPWQGNYTFNQLTFVLDKKGPGIKIIGLNVSISPLA